MQKYGRKTIAWRPSYNDFPVINLFSSISFWWFGETCVNRRKKWIKMRKSLFLSRDQKSSRKFNEANDFTHGTNHHRLEGLIDFRVLKISLSTLLLLNNRKLCAFSMIRTWEIQFRYPRGSPMELQLTAFNRLVHLYALAWTILHRLLETYSY